MFTVPFLYSCCAFTEMSAYLFSVADEYSCEFGDSKYYAVWGFAGVLSCGLTHTAVVPLDLVKCRIQVDAAKYGGIVNGFLISVREGGFLELTKGWAPTLIGYSMQGLCKFGFYEVFKNVYSGILGEVYTKSIGKWVCLVLNIQK